jgi:tRNA pseudouridine32 synthase/23S rRNA pseudouridine746 synthase
MHYKPNNETRQAWIVHRLDRATQGLMLLAHTKKMAQILSHTFESREIHKAYQANIWGEFPAEAQTITLPIDDKAAVSHITLKAYNAELNISRVEVDIETGRKHQIRRHLSESGFPIIGDRLYGDESLDLALPTKGEVRPDLQLTAYKLSFVCPLSQKLSLYVLTEQQLDLMIVE